MDSTNEPISTVHLYAGPCDGMSILAHDLNTTFNVQHSIVINGDESYISPSSKPGQEVRRWVYQHSPEWSAYFGKRTAVSAGFPGKPPREKAAA